MVTDSGEFAPSAHWWLNHPTALPDLLRSARVACENSGHPQRVHHHPFGQVCTERCQDVVLSDSSGEEGPTP